MTSELIASLEQDGDEFRLNSVVFEVSLFVVGRLDARASGLLAAWHEFLTWVPASELRYYATETMARHRGVTRKTFGMLGAWLASSAPPRDFLAFEIHDGSDYRDAPRALFKIFGPGRGQGNQEDDEDEQRDPRDAAGHVVATSVRPRL